MRKKIFIPFLFFIFILSCSFFGFINVADIQPVYAAEALKYSLSGTQTTVKTTYWILLIKSDTETTQSNRTLDYFKIYGSSYSTNGDMYGTIFLNDSILNMEITNYSNNDLSYMSIIRSDDNTVINSQPAYKGNYSFSLPDGSYYIKLTGQYSTGSPPILNYIYDYTFISHTIVIDTVKPNVNATSFTNNGFIKNSVSFSWSAELGGAGSGSRSHTDDAITGSYSKSTSIDFPSTAATGFSSGTTFADPGHYRVKITDNAGNLVEYVFTLDKTAPTGNLSNATTLLNVSNGGFVKDPVSFSWTTGVGGIGYQRTRTEDIISAYYSVSTDSSPPISATIPITNGQTFSEVGHYRIRIQDSAGNYTDYTFTIDKSAPTGSLSGVSNNGFTNNGVSFLWNTAVENINSQRTRSDDTLIAYYSMSTGTSFPTGATTVLTNGQTLNNPGHYHIRIHDSAGNYTDYIFTIDKSAPTGSLSNVDNAGFTNKNVLFSWGTGVSGIDYQRTRTEDSISAYYSVSTGSSLPTNATIPITSGQTFSEVGHYRIKIQDSAGNYTDYTFTIDKSAPIGTLSGVIDKGFANNGVSFLWNTAVVDINSQRTRSEDALTVQYRRSLTGQQNFSGNWTVYNSTLEVEGDYQLQITDKAGNVSYYTFTIDKTAPIAALRTSDNSSLSGDKRTKAAYVYFTWSTSNTGTESTSLCTIGDLLTVNYSYNNGEWSDYTQNQQLTQEGNYTIRISDSAGNYTDYTFTIDRTLPVFNLINQSQQQLSILSPYYNENVTIIWSNLNYTATLNGQPFTSNQFYITDEGIYNFVIVDDIGNGTTLTITIIKHAPTNNFDKLKTVQNMWYETSNLQGNVFAFSNYEDCYNYSRAREEMTREYGTWTTVNWDGGIPIAPADINIAVQYAPYIIYKSIDNPNILHAYFRVDSLNLAIEHYISINMQTRYIPSEPASTADGQYLYRDTYYSRSIINFTTISNTQLYIDGTPYNYPYVLSTPGIHTVREQDFAGNYIIYTVIIDIAPPMLRVTDLTNNNAEVLTWGGSVYKTYGLKLWLDDIDTDALLSVAHDGKTTVYIGATVEIRASGTYAISVRDAAGNTASLILYISLTAPTLSITDNVVNDLINSFNVVISKNGNLNNFSNISISVQKNISDNWTLLDDDNASFPVSISPSNLVYLFDTSGTYRIILVDVFGRWIEQEYVFVKSAPQGLLQASNGTFINSGNATRYNVSFTWSNALSCTATLDGNEYSKNTTITTEGTHIIVISNIEGVSNTYIFTIDKTPPTGNLYYNDGQHTIELENGKTVKYDIFFIWTETNCIALLNNEPYIKNSIITTDGTYTLKLTDGAGNSSSYTFTIKKSLPIGKIYTLSGNLNNGALTNKDVYFAWSESNCSAVVNGSPYIKDSKISIEGTYTILLTDIYGNTNAYYFTIDKTAPIGTLKTSSNEELLSGSSTRYDVRLTWNEPDATAIINSTAFYVKDAVITIEGVYNITLSDAAGNKTIFVFTIKKTAPKGILRTNGNELPNESTTRYDVTFTWTETGCSAMLNDKPHNKNDIITAEGTYVVVLTDNVGNFSTYMFTIDKTPPSGQIIANGESLTSGSVTRFDVIFTWSETNCTALLNNAPYVKGTEIQIEGEYSLKLSDALDNSITYVVIINRTPKTGTLVSNYAILQNESLTRYNTYFTWNDTKSNAYLNGIQYEKGTMITIDGFYEIILMDNIGNESVYTFTLDKTPPDIYAFMTENDINFPINNDDLTNKDIYFYWFESNCSALLNGITYNSNTIISTDGLYLLELIDTAGNKASITITIDKTPPIGKIYDNTNGVVLDNNALTKNSVYFTWAENNCTVLFNGNPYIKNSIISTSGTYTISITDTAGNMTKYFFTIDKETPMAEIFNLSGALINGKTYVQDGFYIIWDKDYSARLNGVDYIKETLITQEGEYTFSLTSPVGNELVLSLIIDRTSPEGKILTEDGIELMNGASTRSYTKFTWTEDNCTATINGEKYSKNTDIFRDGIYTIILFDAAENTSTYTFTLHRALPTGSIISIEKEKELYDGSTTTGTVVFVVFDEDCSILLDGLDYTSGTEISNVGSHAIILRNSVGGERTYTFTIREDTSNNTNGVSLFSGSLTGTILFLTSIGLVALSLLLLPLISSKILKRNPLKRQLKKIN